MEFWYEFEKVIIVIVSVTLAYVEFHQAIILKGSWVKIGMGFIGVY